MHTANQYRTINICLQYEVIRLYISIRACQAIEKGLPPMFYPICDSPCCDAYKRKLRMATRKYKPDISCSGKAQILLKL